MGTVIIENWPTAPAGLTEELRNGYAEGVGNGHVGNRLLSETDRVRVWSLTLKPGERVGFHTHVLDYFWTAVTGGKARSHYADGRVAEVSYSPGDIQHHHYGAGEYMIHNLENIGETELVFITVEFLDSANAPLPLAGGGVAETRA